MPASLHNTPTTPQSSATGCHVGGVAAGRMQAVCRGCGRTFATWRSYLKRRPSGPWCSRQCRGQAMRAATWRCRQCGGPGAKPHRLCSEACRVAASWQRAVQRFERSIERTPTCWLWRGPINPVTGYGFGSRLLGVNAHRAAWALYRGPIPRGLNVLHRCDRPPCVNPDHLFLGTYADNTHDSMQKGRHSAWLTTGLRLNGTPAKTLRWSHCSHGHELSGPNLATYKNGQRVCRTCAAIRSRKYYAAKKQHQVAS